MLLANVTLENPGDLVNLPARYAKRGVMTTHSLSVGCLKEAVHLAV